MAYNPATDFLALWRNNAGVVSKTDMPGLDYVVAALARAGLITLSVSATAPVANQATTAWLQTAVPSYSAEGVLWLWNPVAAAYAPATAALLLKMLETSAGESGVSWWTTVGGAPINTVGNDGDLAIRTDEPGGIYGPKAAGAWPAIPIPGTTDIIGSEQLDLTFGADQGNMLFRGPLDWRALPIGVESTFLFSSGGVPEWANLSDTFDAIFGGVQGSILYRDVLAWQPLLPGVNAGDVLTTGGGVGANPAWAPRTAEFPSGTVMIFRQSAAPVGWTKQVAFSDYGLRVTSGAVGAVAGSPFSTVFAQTVVGDTTLSTGQIPSHSHLGVPGAINTTTAVAAAGHAFADTATVSTGSAGGGGSHNHSVNLALSYLDVIIATKN